MSSLYAWAVGKSLTTAQEYKEDTDVLVEDIQGNPHLARIQPAWKWHHRLLANDGQNLRRLQAFDPTDIRLHTLQEASTFFVQQQLGFPPSSADYRHPGTLLDLAYAREFSKKQDPPYKSVFIFFRNSPPRSGNH